MIQSSQPRKERKFRFNAPLHDRQKFMHAHVSDELAKKLGIKSRSISVRKGDTVKVQSGKHRGKSGKVSQVSLKTGRIFIEGINRKDAKGKEFPLPIYSSNVYLTDLDLTDKLRSAKMEKLKGTRPVTKQQVAKQQTPSQQAPAQQAAKQQVEKKVA